MVDRGLDPIEPRDYSRVSQGHSMTAPTYHLWLKPPSPTYEALAGLIRALAQELTAPVFGPHVTLLGHLEGSEQDHVQRTTRLGELLGPFSIQLGPAASRPEYFKCIFLEVDKSASIMNANASARQLYQRPPEEFMPHLSLVYGSYPETRKKSDHREPPGACADRVPGS